MGTISAAPAPVTLAAPVASVAPRVTSTVPAPVASYTTGHISAAPAPVVENVQPTFQTVAPAPIVAAPAPVVEYVQPSFQTVAPAPVVAAPAPVVEYVQPAPTFQTVTTQPAYQSTVYGAPQEPHYVVA